MSARAFIVCVALVACAQADRPFEITGISVPELVEPGEEVEIECKYDAEFTTLKWFKGRREFFRYSPAETPSRKTFAALGIGTVEAIACGPTACRLRLGGLTEEASGAYRCDTERDRPPYKFAARTAHMTVKGEDHDRPTVTGVNEEYSENEIVNAECAGRNSSEFRWFINGEEYAASVVGFGRSTLRLEAHRPLFPGLKAELAVQCAEFTQGRLLGSRTVRALWRDDRRGRPPQDMRSNASQNGLMNFCNSVSFILISCVVIH